MEPTLSGRFIMKQIKLLCVFAALGWLGLNARAQIVEFYCPLNVALVCQVQQEPTEVTGTNNLVYKDRATTTNLTINTKTLLALIAADQGLTLPKNAKLWRVPGGFYIIGPDNTIFTNVDSGLLNLTYVTNVINNNTFLTANRHYVSNVNSPTTAILTYNGLSVTFTLNLYGKYEFYNESDDNFINTILSTSFSGEGFGSGTSGGQGMIITGSVTGSETQRTKGGAQPFPPFGPS
jgi:hypothetical protein